MIKGLTVSHVVKSALCIAIALIVGCSTVNERPSKSGPLDENRSAAYLDTEDALDDMVVTPRRADWARIAGHWQMDEPVWLSNVRDTKEVYRLWFMPALYDQSVVRVMRNDEGWSLSVRTQDQGSMRNVSKCIFSKSQPDPRHCPYPKLKANSQRGLTPKESGQLERLLGQLAFWNQPERVESLPEFDGVDWTLEGMREDRQTREVNRHSPPENEAFYQFADYLLKLSEVPLPGQ